MWLAHKAGTSSACSSGSAISPRSTRFGAMRGLRVSGGEYWRLVSCILLHGSGMHILLNAIALFALGRLCESVYGPVRLSSCSW
jgi:membrane associated rhomboid family serine protease